MDTIKECRCGGKPSIQDHVIDFPFVRCPDCKARSGGFYEPHKAVDGWNKGYIIYSRQTNSVVSIHSAMA